MTMRLAGVADIGGTNTRVGLISEDGTIIRMERFKTPITGNAEDIAGAVAHILHEITDGREDALIGVGIAAAGPLDAAAGILVHPPNIPFDTVPLVNPLEALTGCTVKLWNDCRAAVLGEVKAGGAKGRRDVVYITISTGIGGGIFSGGRVLTGRKGNAGEIGHIMVDSRYSLTCTCGNTGHWEGYASGRRIPAFFQEWCKVNNYPVDTCLSTPDILNLSSRGDVRGDQFRMALAEINGRGLSTIIVAYDPECIIFDGAVVNNNPELIREAIAYTDRYLELPDIRISPLGGNAPLIGAAMSLFYPECMN